MGVNRTVHHLPRLVRRKITAWTSVGAIGLLVVLWAIAENFGGVDAPASGMPLELAEEHARVGSRSLDAYPPDPLIDRPYRDSSRRGLIIFHIIFIGYMLLGLNTVCDVYFTGALEVMVEKWDVKPDVAGATFMAAGGSAPELFTSLIGACISESDVGFGTIVGSAVFNVLFVIGLCGFMSSGDIRLTWWPLFRDCSYYILGLGLLAYCASDERIKLWEAIILFVAYLLYCFIMYNNARFEALTDTEFQKAKNSSQAGNGKFNAVHPQCSSTAAEVHQDAVEKLEVPSAWEAPESVDTTEAHGDAAPAAAGGSSPNTPSSNTNNAQAPSVKQCSTQGQAECKKSVTAGERDKKLSRASTRRESRVRGKLRSSFIQGQGAAQRHEDRMASIGASIGAYNANAGVEDGMASAAAAAAASHCDKAACEAERGSAGEAAREATDKPAGEEQKDEETGEDPKPKSEEETKDEEEEEEEDDDLMEKPEGRAAQILWYASLPVYVPLYYSMPKPSERWFLLTFAFSLLWIAGFSFFMVWWVEILGEVCHIPTIVMGFTLLAAGTSIPDAVSSVAVARLGQGDMAISSSIGSNIFDILVGLPIPWIIKIGIIDGGKTEVNIRSPYLTFYVLLLLFMVFSVVLCIHLLKWRLNKTLGTLMAVLYLVFLVIAISVESAKPSALKF